MSTCPHCLADYILGENGTVNGCDSCEGIVRNPDGSINYYESTDTNTGKQS